MDFWVKISEAFPVNGTFWAERDGSSVLLLFLLNLDTKTERVPWKGCMIFLVPHSE